MKDPHQTRAADVETRRWAPQSTFNFSGSLFPRAEKDVHKTFPGETRRNGAVVVKHFTVENGALRRGVLCGHV